MHPVRSLFFISMTIVGVVFLHASKTCANEQPNILVIWGDDIGLWNISHNNCGMMGYETPNIDRIANEEFHLRTTTGSRVAQPAGRHLLVGTYLYAQG